MFVCEFSGKVSRPAVFKYVTVDEDSAPVHVDSPKAARKVKVLEQAAEKPVKLVVQTREVKYFDAISGEVIGVGTEIVKEITVKAEFVEAAKKKFNVS